MILLDTHAFVWMMTEPDRLSRHASSAIRRAKRSGGMALSAISMWEFAWLAAHGRLQIVGTVETYLEELSSRVAVLPITAKVAALAVQFPASYPNDPCDRLIGATALAEGMALITRDANMHNCKLLHTIW